MHVSPTMFMVITIIGTALLIILISIFWRPFFGEEDPTRNGQCPDRKGNDGFLASFLRWQRLLSAAEHDAEQTYHLRIERRQISNEQVRYSIWIAPDKSVVYLIEDPDERLGGFSRHGNCVVDQERTYRVLSKIEWKILVDDIIKNSHQFVQIRITHHYPG